MIGKNKLCKGNTIIDLIKILDGKPFMFDGHLINIIEEGFPIGTYIKKENDKYILSINDIDFVPIGDNYEYVFANGNMYYLSYKMSAFLKDLISNNSDTIIIDTKDINKFTKSILPIIKNNITLDESVKDDIVIVNNPECELYFDINRKCILLNIELIYDKKNYFDNINGLLRDNEYENEIINEVSKYGFIINNDKIELSELEKMVNFIDYGLNEISNKYKVFTTEKFNNTNIKHKTGVLGHFGIGQDNIMSYSFDLDGIKSEELVNIFKDMRAKKKYFRLKSGDILNLEDNSLSELNDLVDDMELTDEDIINGKGELLKYRAIYLDSIKDNKYHIVKTNNLFNSFIDNFYKYKDMNITLSKDDSAILRDYQVTGVKWLYNLYKTGFGGILADEMGLGKTIQLIYYIKEILKEDKNAKILIVVPTSLVYNWEHEFELFGNDIKRELIVGIKNKRLKKINKESNVYITTYGLLREDEEEYSNTLFHTVVIDEAQNIKNYMAGISKSVKRIKANTRFALTGTPIENSTLELWSIFDFIMPGYLANITKFQNKYKIHDFDEQTELLIKGLSNQITPFILRRKKKDVVRELPDKFENNIYIDLSDEQKKIYAAEAEKVKKEMNEILNDEGVSKARFLILQLLTKLRQICIEPKIIFENYNGGSNKIDAFVNIVSESVTNGHKVLVFTSFRSALEIVKEKLDKVNIKSYVINGSVSSKDRMKRVDDFNINDDIKVFLIMLKSGGTGLNLASADVVIHLDLWWNPQAENQATDRAHRIGQNNTVEVIRLISKGTVEEKILELQNKKRKLSDKLIDGEARDQNIISELTEEDIRDLLSYENR